MFCFLQRTVVEGSSGTGLCQRGQMHRQECQGYHDSRGDDEEG